MTLSKDLQALLVVKISRCVCVRCLLLFLHLLTDAIFALHDSSSNQTHTVRASAPCALQSSVAQIVRAQREVDRTYGLSGLPLISLGEHNHTYDCTYQEKVAAVDLIKCQSQAHFTVTSLHHTTHWLAITEELLCLTHQLIRSHTSVRLSVSGVLERVHAVTLQVCVLKTCSVLQSCSIV